MERQLFECGTFLETIDKCFKSHCILNLAFASHCQQVWKFIGNVGFNLQEENELLPTALELKNFITANI